MAESAEEVYARIVDTVGADGHLPMPDFGEWDIFPWDVVDGAIVPKTILPPSDDPARWGEVDEKPCGTCAGSENLVWEDENWLLTHPGKPTGLPLALMLHSREHEDFGQLDDDRASELGRISNRLVRIMESLPNIGRAHMLRIGDGGSHLHVWFFGRTARLTGVLGSPASEWDDIIPPGPEDVWLADVQTVAEKLANWGGTARV